MILFLDWDETIVSSDTTALICSTLPLRSELKSKASHHLPHQPQPTEGGQHRNGPFEKKRDFSFYVQEYGRLLRFHSEEFGPRHSIESELEYLGSLKMVEDEIRLMMERDRFFDDPRDRLQIAADSTVGSDKSNLVEFQPGWYDFVDWLATTTIRNPNRTEDPNSKKRMKTIEEVHIISCSWSERFIQSCLSSQAEFVSLLSSVRANEIDLDLSRIKKNERCQRPDGIKTGIDKLKEMEQIMRNHRDSQPDIILEDQSRMEEQQSVIGYIGDSETDLACLLHAHIPILFRPKPSLLKLCKSLSLDVIPFVELPETGDQLKQLFPSSSCSLPNRNRMIQVLDWNQVIKILSSYL